MKSYWTRLRLELAFRAWSASIENEGRAFQERRPWIKTQKGQHPGQWWGGWARAGPSRDVLRECSLGNASEGLDCIAVAVESLLRFLSRGVLWWKLPLQKFPGSLCRLNRRKTRWKTWQRSHRGQTCASFPKITSWIQLNSLSLFKKLLQLLKYELTNIWLIAVGR